MSRMIFVVVCAWSVGLLLPGVHTASAQQFSFRSGAQAVQSLSVGYTLIDFAFDGEGEPLLSFDFDRPAYGLVYTRPRFLATVALGDQKADDAGRTALRLLDFSITTWGELRLFGPSDDRAHLYIPISLFSNYRRVTPQDDDADSVFDAFNVTVLGLGAGLGLDHSFSENTFFAARAAPVIGLANSSLTDAIGTAYVIDSDVQLHLAELFGRIGLSLGYSFRYQVWNINASSLFPEATDELFDYKGHQHLFRVGANW